MQHKAKNGLKWLEFNLLSDIPEITHGIFSRQGGGSSGSFASLNIAYDIGDPSEQVAANIRRIKEALNISHFSLATMEHKTAIYQVTPKTITPTELCDGMITQLTDVGLAIAHADCQAALFYDPVQKAIANVHSGWRGSVQNIYEKAILALKQRYGSRPEDLLVCISPSLGPENAQFIHYRQELPKHFWDYQVKPDYFDFWAISQDQLKASGVLPHHIEIASICTYANSADYFSYRRDRITGRNCTLIALKAYNK
jgi:polyphenol oxidase